MKHIIKLEKRRNPPVNSYLLGVLLLLSTGFAILIAKAGATFGLLLIFGLAGLGLAIFIIAKPIIGFYATIVASFFIFTLLRFLNTEAPLVTAVDVMVYITFAGVVINKAIKNEPFFKNCRSPITFMYLIIVLYNAVEFFNPNGGNNEIYILVMRRFLSLMLFLYCAIQLFTDLRAIDLFFKIMIGLAFVAALYACYEEWVGMPGFELSYIQSDPLRERLSSLDGGNYRKSSFFSSCTDFGLMMAGIIPICLALYLRLKWSRGRRQFLLLCMVLSALAMTYSGTRTATLMLIVEIVLFALMTITERKTIIFSTFFALLFVVIIFGPSYGNGTIRRLKSTFELNSEESLQVRDINRHSIQPYIYAHPLGGGVGTTGVTFYEYNIGHPLAGFPTDSGLLSIVLEYGWVGLIIQCLTYFILLQQGVNAFYNSRSPHNQVLYLSAVVCLFGYVFAQYAQIAIGQIPGGFLFLGLNAVIIRLRQIEAASRPLELKSIK
jgi:putative inorganic carbon (HCO3(-)) transporter